jgi:hypothetical protein
MFTRFEIHLDYSGHAACSFSHCFDDTSDFCFYQSTNASLLLDISNCPVLLGSKEYHLLSVSFVECVICSFRSIICSFRSIIC